MNKNIRSLLLLALPILLLVYLVFAIMHGHSSSPIMGKWIEKFPDGTGMLTEFNTSTMASYRVDSSGSPLDQINQIGVTYMDLKSAIGVRFKDGSGIVVMVLNPTTITLNFPGRAAHRLVKFDPKPLKKSSAP